MPALPVSALLSVSYHLATKGEEEVAHVDPERPFDVVTWQEASDEFPHVRQSSKKSVVANTAFSPSDSTSKSVVLRLAEAAPNPVQMGLVRLGAWPSAHE